MTSLQQRLACLTALVTLMGIASAQDVLVYGSLPSGELPWYSGFGGLNVTTVDEPTWTAMTTAQFAAYDLIWIGGINNIGSPATPYPTLNATKPTWSPAINSGIVVSCLHAAAITHPRPEAMQFIDDAITWLLSGNGTALYVGQDVGLDSFDFLSEFGIEGCAGVGCFTTNNVTITALGLAHPVMAGSTSAGLSGWGNTIHNRLTVVPTGFDVLAEGPGAEPFVIVRDFTCDIAPFLVQPFTGDAEMQFSITEPAALPVSTLFEYSTDFGLTWSTCTAAGASATSNPDCLPTPVSGGNFIWDTATDLPGAQTLIAVRLTADNGVGCVAGGMDTTCTQQGEVDNTTPRPSCVITSPAAQSVLTGQAEVEFTTASPLTNPLTLSFEWSSDGGVTFLPASFGLAPGCLFGNPVSQPVATTDCWGWRTQNDLPLFHDDIVFRITVTDTVTLEAATCSVIVDINNAPECIVTDPSAMTLLVGDQLISFFLFSPLGSDMEVEFFYSIDFGLTFFNATDAGGGAVTGNPAGPLVTGASNWEWDTAADIPVTETAIFRLLVTDLDSGAQVTCQRQFDVDNNPCQLGGNLCGDCDGNGRIQVLDPLRQAKMAVGLAVTPMPGTFEFNRCNVEGVQGVLAGADITVNDALLTARYVVGRETLQCCIP